MNTYLCWSCWLCFQPFCPTTVDLNLISWASCALEQTTGDEPSGCKVALGDSKKWNSLFGFGVSLKHSGDYLHSWCIWIRNNLHGLWALWLRKHKNNWLKLPPPLPHHKSTAHITFRCKFILFSWKFSYLIMHMSIFCGFSVPVCRWVWVCCCPKTSSACAILL